MTQTQTHAFQGLRSARIQSAADVIRERGISTPPVDVIAIAEAYGIRVKEVDGAEWDGAVDMGRPGEPPTIYVNSSSSATRQRFTIAHELGHFFLHGDRQRAFRDTFSSQGLHLHEIEANRFSAELLMPAHWVKAYLRYESPIQLADRFNVSFQAMTIRLNTLGLR
jgi:Zn-dependent peptidase ImmA (M78 family)